MKVRDISDIIETVAPLSAQESYDNSGLIVGGFESEIRAALLCVDITEAVLDEAIELGADMVISHHPIIFHGLKRLTGSSYVERVVAKAIKNGVALYACHTNLDSVQGGISHRLAAILGVKESALLSPTRSYDSSIGFGIVGDLQSPMGVFDFLDDMKSKLNLNVIRVSTINRDNVQRIAICSGSGASLIGAAKSAKADIYIAADFKYNDFLDADREIIIADIGHFESEYCAIDILYDIITKKISTFALHKSKFLRNPINYI